MEKEELKQRCLDAIDANRDLIIQLGDDVYKTPELGYKEFKTTERMIKAFQEIGEEPETEIAYTGCKVSTPKKGNTRIDRRTGCDWMSFPSQCESGNRRGTCLRSSCTACRSVWMCDWSFKIRSDEGTGWSG